MTTVVLPTLPIPADESWKEVPNALVPAVVMGMPLVELRALMVEAGLLDTELIVVSFNPVYVGCANWAPWPTIQMIKASVMSQADAIYEQKHKCPASMIPRQNVQRLHEIFRPDGGAAYSKRNDSCYPPE